MAQEDVADHALRRVAVVMRAEPVAEPRACPGGLSNKYPDFNQESAPADQWKQYDGGDLGGAYNGY